MERRFGMPDRLSKIQPLAQSELDFIKSTVSGGRAHDITLFIAKGDSFIFIAKPFYPPGLFRAPSGGVHPNEDFETGAKREAREETGVEIELEKYILRIEVHFQAPDDYFDWTTYIYTARYLSGEIDPQDKREISAAKLVGLDEVPKFKEIMRSTGRGGFAYRAFLTDEAIKRL